MGEKKKTLEKHHAVWRGRWNEGACLLFGTNGEDLSDASCGIVIVFLLHGDIAFNCRCGMDVTDSIAEKIYRILLCCGTSYRNKPCHLSWLWCMKELVNLIFSLFFLLHKHDIYSCDKTIYPHCVLPNRQKRWGSELRKNAYTKRFHCSLNGFKLQVKQFEADSGLRLLLCDSHLKLGSVRRSEAEEAVRGGKVRVQVCSFENHIMVMMAQTCPRALLGKVISISA